MTTDLFPLQPAHFDLDIERDTKWPLPEARPFVPAQSLWDRVCEVLSAVGDPFEVGL